MTEEPALRLGFTAIFLSTMAVSIRYRRRARRLAGAIPRRAEPGWLIAGRVALALPLYLAMLMYMIRPRWLEWAAAPLPSWLRWLGVGVGVLLVPTSLWIFRSLGANVSETVLTKEGQALVTSGPYRWVRHPLYSAAWVGFVALGLIAASWAILLPLLLVGLALPLLAKREEAELLARFGTEYAEYRARTGRFFPRRAPGKSPRP